ncbi:MULTISPECIES: ead/Ea22-like family protein [Citrobacter]|uniref:ead/Ea22-like family protein n=1 Tax=Citrobacter TaxID=544 RepID=UPI00140FF49E|nr:MULTISPECIES: ead/Ea22-like family protein [Citrobacter]MDR4051520.1 ead/Ea22-like family protein [Citrobacter sp.]MDT7445319.1 ead/Ea22-like family protein [Citrobacter freundii]NHR81982.1 ead/Ea22-like family protein [Citrobacter portucalensis]
MTALNKYAALRKLAKALSGKEWVAFVHKASGTYAVGSLGHERGEDIIKWPGLDGQDNAESKAKFIAAANPATVLALLDELEVAEKRIAELEARTVTLPQYRNSPDMHTKQFYEAIGFNQGLDIFIEALRAAGIGVKGE